METTSQAITRPQSQVNRATQGAIASAILLGIGSAAFFDVIVLHQILQWHHMLTATHPLTSLDNVALNIRWDGLFEAGAGVASVTGCLLLWRAAAYPVDLKALQQPMVGALLWGAGSFNLIEGVVDHHLLQIHHVRSGTYQSLWDIGFLILSAGLALIGWMLLRSPHAATEP